MTVYVLCLIFFAVGLYCVARKRNLVKIIIGLGIMGYAVNLLFILIGYRHGGRSPILSNGETIKNIVDPLPQAAVLTLIVMGLGVTLFLISLSIRIYEKYGTFDITKINKLKG